MLLKFVTKPIAIEQTPKQTVRKGRNFSGPKYLQAMLEGISRRI
jgi:hypothetical protein